MKPATPATKAEVVTEAGKAFLAVHTAELVVVLALDQPTAAGPTARQALTDLLLEGCDVRVAGATSRAVFERDPQGRLTGATITKA